MQIGCSRRRRESWQIIRAVSPSVFGRGRGNHSDGSTAHLPTNATGNETISRPVQHQANTVGPTRGAADNSVRQTVGLGRIGGSGLISQKKKRKIKK